MTVQSDRKGQTGREGWDSAALADPHRRDDKAARVEAMFDAIAPTYERVNSVVSLGRDAAWRRVAIRALAVKADDVALDICCGTGDMIRALATATPRPRLIIGVDFSEQMLRAGHYAADVASMTALVRADAQRLPLADASVDVITCAFGVRNFQDLPRGLDEMRRVLRPGGRVAILEFAPPDNVIARWGFAFYSGVLLPRIAAWISRDRVGAYRYLPRSIQTFEKRGMMAERLRAAGFTRVSSKSLNLGSVAVYRGEAD
ncbi:MAG: bifunctional demethylmenaquinone methyltransferase/2-methoxy-6-polyprenyl-1,4-benzoquinol methylase UbiE [Phycisphaerales bacterium]|nr:bifunctional demethylmenaquinone methyltransferase/2-methoxy-6-polyprenyl-1,4-benzoquinol methylase UbiE [Phycisphaerales bacterium]